MNERSRVFVMSEQVSTSCERFNILIMCLCRGYSPERTPSQLSESLQLFARPCTKVAPIAAVASARGMETSSRCAGLKVYNYSASITAEMRRTCFYFIHYALSYGMTPENKKTHW